jgi:hypothetical protein
MRRIPHASVIFPHFTYTPKNTKNEPCSPMLRGNTPIEKTSPHTYVHCKTARHQLTSSDVTTSVQGSGLLCFWTLSIVWYSKKLESTMFQKLDLFPSSVGWVGGDTYPVGSLRKNWPQSLDRLALSKGPNRVVMPPSPGLRMETDPVSDMLCSLVF